MSRLIALASAVALAAVVSGCGPVGVAKTAVTTTGKVTVGTVRTATRVAF